MEIVIPDFDSDIPAPAFGQAAHKREHSNPDPHFGFPDSSNRASSRPFGGTSNHALPRSFAPAALGGLGSMPSPTSDANGMGGPIGYDMRRKESVASSASSHPTAVSMSTSNSLASSTGPGNYHGRKGSIATPQRSFHRTASSDVFGSNAAPPIPSGLAGLRSRSNTGVSTIGAGADGHAPLEVGSHRRDLAQPLTFLSRSLFTWSWTAFSRSARPRSPRSLVGPSCAPCTQPRGFS